MGLALGGLFSAAANLTTTLGHEKSLKSFIDTVNDFGVQVQNNFEVNFSGLEDLTFYVQDISLPRVHQNFTTVNFDGRAVDIPINHEYDHEWSMTMLNDALGYLYSALISFIATDSSNVLANSGYTMTIKALTGNESKYAGSLITCRGVRIESVAGLSFGQSLNDVQTFTINGKLIDYTVSPGALGKVSGVVGTINSLIG